MNTEKSYTSTLTKKARNRISVLYGLLTGFANFLGVMLPNTFTGPNPEARSLSMTNWLAFLDAHKGFVIFITVMTFSLPAMLCYIYMARPKQENFHSRFINLPSAYAFLGISGWITYGVIEVIFIVIVKDLVDIDPAQLLISSGMYIFIESLFTFTLSYFAMETIHRHHFLPKYYPGGHLDRFKSVKTPSFKFLFFVFYISCALFPAFYIFNAMLELMVTYSIPLNTSMVILFIIVLLLGIFITINFSHSIHCPIEKLQKTATKIKEGNFSEKADIISNDAFGTLADTFNEMTDSILEKSQRIIAIQNSVITGMATMVESRDNSTGGHIKRTSDCVRVFINELKKTEKFQHLTDNFCTAMIKAAPMHDLGKIAVDDAILRKPGKFEDWEYEKMKIHSKEGARIVENVLSEIDDMEFKTIAINVAHYHHERWNGSGYPEKLSTTQIPFEARIMALADVFDALVSKRCYKDSFSYDQAFSIIKESSGTHFDPELTEIFLKCRPQLEELYNAY